MSANNLDFGSLFGQMFGIPIDDLRRQAAGGPGNPGPIPADATQSDADPDEGGAGNPADDGGVPPVPPVKGPSVFETIAKWSKRALIILVVVALVVLAGCYWWYHPAINLHSNQVWGWIILVAAAVAAGLWIAGIRHEEKKSLFHKLLAIPAAVVVAYLIGIAAGWSIIPGNAARYASILKIEDGNFASDINEVDYSEIPVIDRDSAILLGNRAMGSIPEYVSQFEISSIYSQINYQGRPVRVSPLNYADLFKWFINRKDGIPAYVIVDMTTQDAEVVRLEQPILYAESEPLGRNIDRYVQLTYPTYMFDEKSFELDEDGTPWWVFPVQKRTVGLFDGTTIQRVVLVNACTGDTLDYAIDECPQWVDRAYPSDLLVQQYNWYGLYSGGWLNSWLGQVGVVQTTPGTNGKLGYNYIAQNDDVYLYTGVSSVTADNSIIGFILVNQRTAASRFFTIAGATEDSAMSSAEGAVQHLKYSATFPLLLNIEGEPTYFMALKDAAGLVKKYAMVNITQYQNVATGDTVAECQQQYVQLLAQMGTISSSVVRHYSSTMTVTGTIGNMVQGVVDGNSHFYITLEGFDGIFDAALPGLLPVITYQVGDAIELAYVEGEAAFEVTALGKPGSMAAEPEPAVATAKPEPAVAAQPEAKDAA